MNLNDPNKMNYVYILISLKNSNKHYVGLTQNLEVRLKQHNRGDTSYTKNFAPWKIETFIAFNSKALAEQFERYLKHGSGNAFLRKRLLPS